MHDELISILAQGNSTHFLSGGNGYENTKLAAAAPAWLTDLVKAVQNRHPYRYGVVAHLVDKALIYMAGADTLYDAGDMFAGDWSRTALLEWLGMDDAHHHDCMEAEGRNTNDLYERMREGQEYQFRLIYRTVLNYLTNLDELDLTEDEYINLACAYHAGLYVIPAKSCYSQGYAILDIDPDDL